MRATLNRAKSFVRGKDEGGGGGWVFLMGPGTNSCKAVRASFFIPSSVKSTAGSNGISSIVRASTNSSMKILEGMRSDAAGEIGRIMEENIATTGAIRSRMLEVWYLHSLEILIARLKM
jgi:hypothetical protein